MDDAHGSTASPTRTDHAPPRLRIKRLPIDTHLENVVLLARDCPALRPERLRGSRKVMVKSGDCTIIASILITDDRSLLDCAEIGLSDPAFRRLGARGGDEATIAPAPPALSLDAVRAKVRGETLSFADLTRVVSDIASHRLSDLEVSAFVVACASFMTAEEVIDLTRAMVNAGSRLRWDRPLVVDKHSIGGIPGNRTSMIVAPIVAAHGLLMPKTSSRAITSPAGTADTMEVLAKVDLKEADMHRVVDACGACIAWGGHVNLSPADDVIIGVERPLQIDAPEQMVASIVSKKVAAGVTHLVLDLPIGPTAKIRSGAHAQHVRKLFEHVARHMNLDVRVMITDAVQPIGRGIGPALEARDVLSVLNQAPDAPRDLREKALTLAAEVLEFDPELPGGAGRARAEALLSSGAARTTFERMLEAQGPPPRLVRVGELAKDVAAPRDGIITAMDCFRIARIARLAGAPTDPGAGLDLLKRIGDTVRAGEPLYRLHAEDPSEFALASAAIEEDSGVSIGASP
ncbi:MAG: thymidine phosphorylase family protein [Alphaproteobacteria bacterium]|nr:thymidine phosphorylase family protein [Alphaproteobacteria bacterium]